MDNQNYLLNDNDVISTGSSTLMFQSTFTIKEFVDIMQSRLAEEKLFTEGLECKMLSPGQDWLGGKIKIRLEFISDGIIADENLTEAPLEMDDDSSASRGLKGNFPPLVSTTQSRGTIKPANTEVIPLQTLRKLPDSVLELMPPRVNAGMWS